MDQDSLRLITGRLNLTLISNDRCIEEIFSYNDQELTDLLSIDVPRTGSYSFLISLKGSDLPIGVCGFIPSDVHSEQKCFFILDKMFRGNGYAIESLKSLIEFGFKELNLKKIKAFIPLENRAAWKTVERSGMKYFGDKLVKKQSQKMMFFCIEKATFNGISSQ